MTAAFSYFNTATGAIHLVADLPRLERAGASSRAIEDARALAHRWWTDPPEMEAVRTLLGDLVLPAQRDLIQHELRHVHQLLFYPYLYLRGIRALVAIGTALDAVRDWGDVPLTPVEVAGTDLPRLDPTDPALGAIRQSLYVSAARYWFEFGDGAARPVAVNLNNPGASYLTEQHLLEDEVAVYQYRVGGGEPEGAAFAAWRDELPGDCPTFRLLRAAFGDADLAVRLLPLLVFWAYQTTIPMGTFVELVTFIKAAPSWFDLTNEFLVNMLIEEFIADRYARPGADFPFLGLSQNDLPVRLNSDFSALREAAFHPCAPHLTSLAGDGPAPMDVIYPDSDMATRLELLLPPPAILVRIRDPSLGPGAVGFSLYPHPERFPGAHDGRPWKEVVLNLEYAYEVAQIVLFGRQGVHGCPHRECSARSRLCRNYPFVPRQWEDCRYPTWMRDATHHEVDRRKLIFRRVIRGKSTRGGNR